MDNPILTLENLHKSYAQAKGSLSILKGISLSLNPEEIVGLVGVSGSGKSTLLHLAGLLDTPTEGTVTIDGVMGSKETDTVRTKIRNEKLGFIYQFHHLLPEFTALENITLPALIQGKKRAEDEALYYLDRLGLQDRAHHFPSELSGGEKQRVAIARALINRPKLIIADEPTGNLDPETAQGVFDLFVECARKTKVACLIATHDPALMTKMDRVFEMKNGLLRMP